MFFHREIILKFFGEDVSKLTQRRNCCDNCNTILDERNEEVAHDEDKKSGIKIKTEQFDDAEDSKKGIKIKEEKLDANNVCKEENMGITIKKEPKDSDASHSYFTRNKRQKLN